MVHEHGEAGRGRRTDGVEQLRMLDESRPDWQLDEHTREVGLAGVRRARAALAARVPRAA